MLGNTQVEVLQILIRAKDESQATLRETAAHVEGMRGHLAGFGQGMMTAGLGIGGAVAAIAGGSLKLAADFEKTMSGVAAVSGASAQQMKQLSGLALQLGKDTSFSAQEAGKGIEELVKGGVSIADILSGAAKATLNLAAAGGVDLPTAATIAANALNTFNLQGRDMAHVADMIAGAANASSLDVNDFKFSLAAAGSIAKTIGFSFDDLSVAIAELGAAGLRGSDAGTSLKTLFINLSPQTSHAADMMKKLGIITKDNHNLFFDHAGRIRSLAEVQGVLHRALSGLTKEQQINALHTMFGTDAMRAAAILAGQGAEGYDKMSTAMRKVTAEGVAATRLGNLAGQIEQLKGSLETLGIIIGQALLPPATAFVKALTGIVNHGIEIAQRLGPAFIKTALAIGGIVAAALTAGGAIAMIVAVMNPIGLAVTALVAGAGLLGAAWATNWGGIRDTVATVWAALQPTFQMLGDAWQDISDSFAGGGLEGAFSALLIEVPPLIDALVTWITGTALPAIGSAVGRWGTALWGWVQQVAPPLLARLGVLLGQVGGWLRGTGLPLLAHAVGSWAGALWHWVQQATPPLLAHLGTLLGRLGGWITGTAAPTLGHALGRWATAFWGWVQHVTPPLLAHVGALLGRLGAWITGTALPAIGHRLLAWGTAFIHWIGPATASLVSHLGPLLDRFGGWIGNTALPAIGKKLALWGTAFWHWIEVAGPLMERKLGEFLGKMLVWIPVATVALVAKVYEWGTAFIGWLLPRWISFLGKLNEFLLKIGTWIVTTALPKLLKFGWDMGTNLLGGMAKGIKDAGGGVIHALTHVLDHAKHHARTHTKSHSPSLVYAAIGQDMMAGLAQGITGASGLAQTAINGALNGAQQAGEHWVKGYHVAAHMIAGHYTHAGHWVKAHLVRAHEVAGHWAHNPTHAAAAAASASTLSGAGAATTGAGGVQLVALVSAAGSPLEPLPVTLVNAAGQALALAGGATSAALGGAGGPTQGVRRSALGVRDSATGLPIGHGMGHEGVYGGAGATLAPARRGSGLAFGAHPHGGAVHVAVHVHDGAVRVSSTGSPDGAVMGNVVGNAVVDALQSLAESQARSTPPARRTLPGAL